MPDNRIQLVCFDLGGVLIETAEGWSDAAARAGVLRDVRLDAHQISKATWEVKYRWKTGFASTEEFAAAVARCTPGTTVAELMAVFEAMLLLPYPGVDDLLARLRREGFKTACLSNTNDRHWDTVMSDPAYRALKDLDYLFASHLIHHAKPQPEAYHVVEQATGIQPGSILFFDDLPENVEAARECGWHARQIQPGNSAIAAILGHLHDEGVL